MNNFKKNVMAVNGLISVEKLGHCQCHEHIFIEKGKSFDMNPALCIDDYKMTVDELNNYKEMGGSTLVDAQPVGCGRMTEYLIKASKETGVNIIASTGFHKLQYYPRNHWIYNIEQSKFTELLLNEIVIGMYIKNIEPFNGMRTSAKAGIIKIAIESGNFSSIYKKILLSAADAANQTGITIMCHTDKGRGALEVIKLLMANGVSPESIIICHLDRRSDNFKFHQKVAETGVYLDYDTIGRFKYHSDEEEIKLISKMIDRGYEDKLLISLDTTRERLKSYGSNIGLDYILAKFIPALKKYGINNDIINKITRKNPAEALTRR